VAIDARRRLLGSGLARSGRGATSACRRGAMSDGARRGSSGDGAITLMSGSTVWAHAPD